MDSPGFELVAVNDLIPADHLVYLIRYDSVYGPYRHKVVIEDSTLMIDDHRVKLFSEPDPARLPWRDMNIYRPTS
jgi:glyceraldehyde-3-phosphate dehydrogenase/erythrose-4-phosphate dehydrogenase